MISPASFPSLLRKLGPLTAVAVLIRAGVPAASAFVVAPAAPPSAAAAAGAGLGMGIFDMFGDAFKNEEFDDRRATASHILVATEEEAAAALESLGEGGAAAFAAAARERSSCPSAAQGGSLGTFAPGEMAREFEDVVFDAERAPVGEVVGPVKTEFGWHLILVEDRFVNMDRSDGEGFF